MRTANCRSCLSALSCSLTLWDVKKMPHRVAGVVIWSSANCGLLGRDVSKKLVVHNLVMCGA